MIISLEGQLVARMALSCIVSAHGVGYEVFVPVSLILPAVGNDVKLFIYAVYREDAQTLYGFNTLRERDFFKLIVEKVSGIGPKTALAMLSKFRLEELINKIASRDAKSIAQVPGIGKKTAEKLVLELSDKIGGVAYDVPDISTRNDAILGLVALGYKRADAESMIRDVFNRDPDASVETLIKEAIRVK